MSASIQKQVIDEIEARLTSDTPPAPVYRCRVEPFNTDPAAPDVPAINVFPGEESPDWAKGGNDEYRLSWPVRVECIVAAQSQVDVAADPLRVWCQQKLMADRTLGGLVEDCCIQRVFWEVPENKANVDTMFLVLLFEVKFATLAADPTVNASYEGA